jgi:protein-tyrosine-phosphatase
MTLIVLFVCPHGAAKSRVAAAFFNHVAPPGWEATSAGIEPDRVLSQTAARLLEGTDAATRLDPAAPRSLAEVASARRIVGIDCAPEGATDRWELRHRAFDAAMRDELRTRAEALAVELAYG